MSDFLISVIIPTFNSERTLPLLLNSLKAQTFKNFEVILVDKFSTDTTLSIAEAFKCKVISSKGLLHEARRIGGETAKGEYLLHIDSDHELEPDVLKQCNEAANRGVKLAEIPELIVAEGFWGKCRQLEAKCYLGDPMIESPRFIERAAFLGVEGMTTRSAEDWDLREALFRKGYTMERITAHKLHHEGRVRLWKRLCKKFSYSDNLMDYISRNPTLAVRQTPILRGAFFRNWKLLVQNPVTSVGLVLMKFLETFTFLFGLIYHFIILKLNRHHSVL